MHQVVGFVPSQVGSNKKNSVTQRWLRGVEESPKNWNKTVRMMACSVKLVRSFVLRWVSRMSKMSCNSWGWLEYLESWKRSAGWCSTPTQLLICSSFSRENGHPLLICSSLSTAQSANGLACWFGAGPVVWIPGIKGLGFLGPVPRFEGPKPLNAPNQQAKPWVAGWGFQPSEKYAQVKWGSSSPRFGMKIPNIWVATT